MAKRFYPEYHTGKAWERWQQRGKEISFATHAEAEEYLKPLHVGKTRIEEVDEPEAKKH